MSRGNYKLAWLEERWRGCKSSPSEVASDPPKKKNIADLGASAALDRILERAQERREMEGTRVLPEASASGSDSLIQ